MSKRRCGFGFGAGYAAIGVAEVMIVFRSPFDRETVERVDEVRAAPEPPSLPLTGPRHRRNVGSGRIFRPAKGSDVRRRLSAILGRIGRVVSDLLPSGGIGEDSPPPDIDGRRDADLDYGRAVLMTKTQMSSGGKATTSFDPVERRAPDDR